MANDLDPQGLPLTITSYTQPANGALSLNTADGSFTYTPHTGFTGTDTFTYILTNGILQSGAANVAITVINQPVQAKGDSFTLNDNGTLNAAAGAIGANDINPDNAAVQYYLVPNSGPRHGTLSFNADGSFTYTPNSSFAGIDQFLYEVSDGNQSSNFAPVLIVGNGNLKVPPNFASTAPIDPSTFPNTVKGLWHSYQASIAKLTDAVQAMADEGGLIQGLAAANPPSDAQLDAAIAGLEKIYATYDAYVAQQAATVRAAATYMSSILVTWQSEADVLNAINSLPLTIKGLSANAAELGRYQTALNEFADGASLMVEGNGEVVQIAETTHAVAERTIQVLAAATIVGAGLEVLANEGLTACAEYAAKQIIANYAVALAANAAAQQAASLATWLGVDPAKVQICADGIQLLFLLKAARAEQLAAGSNCFVAGTEVITSRQSDGTFSQKPIQDIRVGDEVLTRDQYHPNGPLEKRKVSQLYRHTVYQLEDVTIQDATGKSETVSVTPEHPFYVQGIGWTGSSHLIAGEHLLEPDGSAATVVSTAADSRPGGVTVYNFEVDHDHTYFVDQGAAPIWVHNDCNSRALGNALGNRGQHVAAGDEAHHIVAVNDARATVAQGILRRFNIGINEAENGAWVPSSQHRRIHTDAYYRRVDNILFRARGSKASVLAALKSISSQIANGTFP